MSAKSTHRMEEKKKKVERRAKRRVAQLEPGGMSRYARKAAYCNKHGAWGFEVPEPKPWRGADEGTR